MISFLSGGNVNWAIGFCLLPVDSTSSTALSIKSIISGTGSHIIPLFHASNWSQVFASEQYTKSVLQQYLQPQGLQWGVGEIALYQTDLQSVTFNSPAMQAVFQAVNAVKGIVMIHLSTVNMGGRATELSEIEPSVRDYPDTIFLFHGRKEDMQLVAQLMDKYSNVYFTIDANDSIFTSKLVGYNLLFPGGAAADTAERFLADINRIGTEALVQNGLNNLETMLELYPDRVLWGTDLSYTWHFDDSVFDVVINLSREVIGRLPADLQEKYAYKNAQKIFECFLTSNP
ncbi:MAG: amidohydrolase family protein [Chloroflexi bacterium]|nr:amidohydrolase family protein [Chloroflexota bacterium]